MFSALPIDNFEVEFSFLLPPSCNVTFWFFEGPQPRQTAVIRSDCEFTP
ncbi:hypothetical protein T03_7243, partial [Trichinella britovi]